MKRSMKIALWALGATALVGVAGTAAIAAGEGLHHQRGAWFHKHIAQEIDGALDAAKATPEQRAAIAAARERAFATLHEERGDRRNEIERALALLEQDKVDPAAVKALREGREASMRRSGDAVVQALTEAHDVLRPDQRRTIAARFDAKLAEHHGGPGLGHAMMRRMAEGRVEEALDAVRATPEQRTAIHAAVDQAIASVEETFRDRGADLRQAVALFAEERIDAERVAALRATHQARLARAGDAIAQAFEEVHDALTHDQRVALAGWVRAHVASHFGAGGGAGEAPAAGAAVERR
jgi:Spy/CpxP family protein refolding chaperone